MLNGIKCPLGTFGTYSSAVLLRQPSTQTQCVAAACGLHMRTQVRTLYQSSSSIQIIPTNNKKTMIPRSYVNSTHTSRRPPLPSPRARDPPVDARQRLSANTLDFQEYSMERHFSTTHPGESPFIHTRQA
ncbi:hypothetical protein K440DRAFT_610921 [Wilcoxina mikolae CBS 423.85]|nr:hypothetical protein K440DRAFT_610921 [Wilcoxina mikolae CBS 423.85]